MQPRYIRNFPALTEEEFRCLRTKRALVVGCGGLGGHIIDLLSRIGIGAIRAVDGDVFDETNLNRQLLSETGLLGIRKSEAAAQRVARVNPDVAFEGVHGYMTSDNVKKLLSSCDIVMDGLDNIESRKTLASACEKMGIPYVYGGISGWVAQAGISMPGDKMIETLYPDGVEAKDKSVLSFTPALCAAMQVSLAVKLLVGRPVQTGTIYYFDLLNQEFETIPML